MDRITRSLLENFIKAEGLSLNDESEAFEHFSNYTIISSEYSEQFDINDVHAGSGNDTGIDGIGIIVNGTLVTDEQEITDLYDVNKYIDATFIFIQGKTSSKFETSEFGTFAFGVRDFFAETPTMLRNEAISKFASLQECIFSLSTAMTKGKPKCKLFYVTTGT